MRIPYKTRLLIAISVLTVVFIAGCVDTSVNPIPNSVDYSSQLKVVNLVTGVSQQAALTLNGTSLGTADFGSEVPGSGSAFLTLGAGAKTFDAAFSNALTDANQGYKFSLTTDYKYRLFMVGTAVTDTFSIASVTRSNDIVTVITSGPNTAAQDQQVLIEGVAGMTDLNKVSTVLETPNDSTFTILLATSQNYTGGGSVIKTLFNTNVVRVAQRYIWQTKDSENGAKLFPADTGWVAFFNGSPDAVLNSVSISGTSTSLGDLAMGDEHNYIKLAAGNYTFDVTYDTDQHVTFDYTVASKGRYTAVIYDAAASIKNTVFIDD
jgi:hypothetical protein